jgi:hypothetical protein
MHQALFRGRVEFNSWGNCFIHLHLPNRGCSFKCVILSSYISLVLHASHVVDVNCTLQWANGVVPTHGVNVQDLP